MKPPLRIAVLESDTPMPKTKAKYGRYGAVHEQLIRRGAAALGLSKEDVNVKYYDVQSEDSVYPDLDDIDAIWMTGARFNAYDNNPWILNLLEYTKKLLAQDRVRIVAICFGLQIVARAMGARVGVSDLGWEISVTPLNLSQKGKDIFKTEGLSIYEMHRDIIYGFPDGAESLGETDRCQNQGMYAKGRFIGVQGHPEFTKEVMDEILHVRHAMGLFTDEMFEDGMKRLADHDDGVLICQGFLRFLLED